MGSVDFDAWCAPRALAQFVKEERARGNAVPEGGGVGLMARMRRAGPERLREPDLPRAPLSQLELDAHAQRAASPAALLQTLRELEHDPQFATITRTLAAFDTPKAIACLGWMQPRANLAESSYFGLTSQGWGVIYLNEHCRHALRPLTVEDLRQGTLADVALLKDSAYATMAHAELPKVITTIDRPPPPSLGQRFSAWLRHPFR